MRPSSRQRCCRQPSSGTAFRRIGLDFEPRVLPCGHYTTGETPYKFIDGWYMGWFVYRAFKALREEKASGLTVPAQSQPVVEEEAVSS